MVIATYQKFKWWQKVLFYLGLPQVLNPFFWFMIILTHLNPKYKNQKYKETATKYLYYFGYVHLIILVLGLISVSALDNKLQTQLNYEKISESGKKNYRVLD